MENNTSPPKPPEFQKPISIFEAIALQAAANKDNESCPPTPNEKESVKEKHRGEFLFPIGMLF
jgi:hypothetical protein